MDPGIEGIHAGHPRLTHQRRASLDVSIHGTKGELYAMWLSLPNVPKQPPVGDLWIDPRTEILAAIGAHGTTEVARVRLAISNLSSLRGIPLAWQGLGGSFATLATTNVFVATVH